jgi:hypothetical protein
VISLRSGEAELAHERGGKDITAVLVELLSTERYLQAVVLLAQHVA